MTSRIIPRRNRPTLTPTAVRYPIIYPYPSHPALYATFILLGSAILSMVFIFTSPLLSIFAPSSRPEPAFIDLLLPTAIFSAGVLLLFWLDVGITYWVATRLLYGIGKIEHLAYRSALPSALILIGGIGVLCLSAHEGGGNLWIGIGELFILLPVALIGIYTSAVRETLDLRDRYAIGIAVSKVVAVIVVVVGTVLFTMGTALEHLQ